MKLKKRVFEILLLWIPVSSHYLSVHSDHSTGDGWGGVSSVSLSVAHEFVGNAEETTSCLVDDGNGHRKKEGKRMEGNFVLHASRSCVFVTF